MTFSYYLNEKDKLNNNVKYCSFTEYIWNDTINKKELEERFNNINEPIVIRGLCKPIVKNENIIDYLRNNMKDEILPIEKYNSYFSYYNGLDDGEITDMYVSEYFDNILNEEAPFYYMAELNILPIANIYFTEDNLYKQFENPNYKIDNHKGQTIFVGNNTTSGCHCHVTENYILNQIYGRKIVYLFDYSSNDHIISKYKEKQSNFIKENFFELDHSKFKNLYKVILEPGDSLCIPPWWYHAVRGINVNCSITNVYGRYNMWYLLFPEIKYYLILARTEEYFEYIMYIYYELLKYKLYIFIFLLMLIIFLSYYFNIWNY
jgi:hypothetical protein